MNNTGPMPPPILLLSDGGHVENLALLPLLKKRLKKIVVVDGGHKEGNKHYGDSLLNALMLARTYLDCSFLSKDGGDVISFLFDTFQEPKKGKLPRFFKFVHVFFLLSELWVVCFSLNLRQFSLRKEKKQADWSVEV